MRNKWRKFKPDAKKSFLAKLFGPCGAGKHDQCAVELAMYRCSCNCHYPKSDASEGERQPSQSVASGNATQRQYPRKNNLKSYFAYERSRTHLDLSCMGAKEPDGVLGKHNQSGLWGDHWRRTGMGSRARSARNEATGCSMPYETNQRFLATSPRASAPLASLPRLRHNQPLF